MHNGNHYEESGESGWSAFIAGAFVGAAVALLFAPQRGSELRGMLSDYANRAKDDLEEIGQEAWDTAVDRGKDYIGKGKEVVGDAGRSAKEFAKQAKDMTQESGR